MYPILSSWIRNLRQKFYRGEGYYSIYSYRQDSDDQFPEHYNFNTYFQYSLCLVMTIGSTTLISFSCKVLSVNKENFRCECNFYEIITYLFLARFSVF